MGKTFVKVVPHKGRTAISVDGKVIPGMSYHTGKFDIKNFSEMVEAGIKIFLCYCRTLPKNKEEKANFEEWDAWMEKLGHLTDDIWFIPRIGLYPPRWWAEMHPEELVRFADSSITDRQADQEYSILSQPSMASRRWREDTAGWLTEIVRHIEESFYGDRVLGYMLSCGGTEEWVYFGAQQGRVPDYSRPALDAFRLWLLDKYGSEKKLSEAWHSTSLTLKKVEIPPLSDRRRCHPSMVRNPKIDMPSIDYDLFLSHLCAETLLYFCHVVKKTTGGRRLTGGFSDYLLWQTGWINPVVNNAHLALRELIDSPDIDFITGITSYDNREPGGPGSFMLPVESLQAGGKLSFNEVDVRTHLIANVSRLDKYDVPPQELLNLWPLKKAEESVSVYRREFAHHIIHGAAWWNFDMQGGWYSCPEILQDFAVQSGIARKATGWDMSSTSEVAGIVSGESPAYQMFSRMQDAMRYLEWTELQCDRATANIYRAGVPIDWWLSDDLGREELKRYRVLYFYNPFYLSDLEKKQIEKLKSENRTLVFVGLPGLVTDRGLEIKSAIELTGINLKLSKNRQPLLIDIINYDDPATAECEVYNRLGTGALVSPCMEIDDAKSRVLGTWHQTGRPAMAVREFKNWRSIYSPAPVNHADIFRAIARSAGCHIWVDSSRVIFANRSLLAVHIDPSSDPVMVNLPCPMKVTEVFSDRLISPKCRSFIIQDTRRHNTFLYHLEPVKKG